MLEQKTKGVFLDFLAKRAEECTIREYHLLSYYDALACCECGKIIDESDRVRYNWAAA